MGLNLQKWKNKETCIKAELNSHGKSGTETHMNSNIGTKLAWNVKDQTRMKSPKPKQYSHKREKRETRMTFDLNETRMNLGCLKLAWNKVESKLA